MSTFNKFDWFKAIYAEHRFTDGEKAVLGYIAVVDVLTGKDTFCIRQSTIAEQCGTSRKTVNSAIGRAKRLGYLSMSSRRAPGWGRHGADELRLSIPKSCNESAHNSAESCNRNDQSHVTEKQKSCNPPNAPTSGNNDPYSSSHSSLDRRGSPQPGTSPAARPAAADPPPPTLIDDEEPPPCPRHPNGTTDNCGACGSARRDRKAWQHRRLDQLNTQLATIRQQIDNCDDCDQLGHLIVADKPLTACPKHRNFRHPDIVAMRAQRDECMQATQ